MSDTIYEVDNNKYCVLAMFLKKCIVGQDCSNCSAYA